MADVVANGVRHHVQRIGKRGARPVTFIHGLVMDNLSSFYFTLANPLAETRDVVLYDLRGHGMSERPTDHYDVPSLVEDLRQILDALEIDQTDLVGNSFGGLIALAFAAAHPTRVGKIFLIDAHTGIAGWADQMTATLSLKGDARDSKIAESFQSWLGRHSERKRTRLAQAAEALVEKTSLIRDLRDSPPLGAITADVTAVYGETSDIRAQGEALGRDLHARVIIFPGCTHSVLWEATPAVKAALVEWAA
ncbi:MAG: alpha/beta hydrolase [Kofleriaceae bacterium]